MECMLLILLTAFVMTFLILVFDPYLRLMNFIKNLVNVYTEYKVADTKS